MKNLILGLLLLFSSSAWADVLIDTGGGSVSGYLPDQYYFGGQGYTVHGFRGTVYRTERRSSSGFSYAIPVTPGQVQVTLRLRESCFYCSPARSFSVMAEGQTVLSQVQVPPGQVGDQTFTVTTDSVLNLVFTALTGAAYVNAIEVRQLGGGTPPPNAPTLTLTANPTSVTQGQSSTLTWTSANATACTASGAWSGSQPLSGSAVQSSLQTSSTYTLSCTGAGGSVQKSATVAVTAVTNPVPTVALSANPASVQSGGASTLTWSSNNATGCTASGGWSGAQSLSGSQSTGALTSTTGFSLSCSGAGGSASTTTTVSVTQPPPPPPPNAVFPVHANPGQKYLSDAQGNPFMIVGDAAWSLMVQLNDTQVEQYLTDRQSRGFNTLLVNLIEHKFAANAPKDVAGDAPFLTAGDFSTPNEAYFAHVADVMQRALNHNMLILMCPAYLGYQGGDEGWYQDLIKNSTATLTGYGQYVANRLSAYPNILWVNGCDYVPPSFTQVNAIANGIRSVNATWLQTYHAQRGTPAYPVVGTQPWFSVNTIYTDSETVVSNGVSQYAQPFPFFLIEAIYEGENTDHWGVRLQAYQAVLSGAFGQVMGNFPLWEFDSGWQSAMSSNGSIGISFLHTLMASKAWWTLVPDTGHTLLTSAWGSGSGESAAAVASDGSFALLYTPVSKTLTVNLAKLRGPAVNARWYNPATGAYSTVSGAPFAASGSQSFTTPGGNGSGYSDWVLVLDSQ